MARKVISQLKAWSRIVVTPGEPMITTHAFAGVGPGSYAVVTHFQKRTFHSVLSCVESTLAVQVKNWQQRRGYDPHVGRFVRGVLRDLVRAVLKKTLAPLRIPDAEDAPQRDPLYAIPFANLWNGVDAQVHRFVQVNPVVVVKVEENPAVPSEPRPLSVHGLLPIKPCGVLCASELLSCSFKPAEHRVLMHAPLLRDVPRDEKVAANIVLMSRVSAMADFAVTPETAITSDMLRHGTTTRDLRQHVARQGGRWVMRHVHMARDGAAAPQLHHPSGCIDGGNDRIPNMEA